MNINKIKKAYFIGIKGVGMTALAELLKFRGVLIVGSDIKEPFLTDKILKKENIKVYEGFSSDQIDLEISDTDVFVYSTAYTPENNEELKQALKTGVPVMSYPDVVSELFNESKGIAVAGSHGKTTVSAMLSFVLKESGFDPTALIGSVVPQFEGNALNGKSDLFILEADEYQHKLLKYKPKQAIITNIDWDHPDVFPTEEDYIKDFKVLAERLPKEGILAICAEESKFEKVIKNVECKILKYGFSKDHDYNAQDIKIKNSQNSFVLYKKDEKVGEIDLQLIGDHNVLNALSVIAISENLGVSFEKIKSSLENFQGTERRMELKGEYKGAKVFDDYAHHPEEIKATLKGVREFYPDKNIICVFQPHTFTRTKSLLNEFADSFADAEKIIVIDIYGSAREEQGRVSSQDLVEKINAIENRAKYISTIEKATSYLKENLTDKDILITMGAGDVWRVGEKFIN